MGYNKYFNFCKIWLFIMVLHISSCQQHNENYRELASEPAIFHKALKGLTEIIVHDIFSPPVASRIYYYTSLAAYEALVHDYPGYISLSGQLNGLTPVPEPIKGETYCLSLSATHAFLVVGRKMIFSENKMDLLDQEIYGYFKNAGIPANVYKRSIEYGSLVAKHILEWADTDNYKQTRTFPKYTVLSDAYAWKPTPPDYMEGIEPHWDKIRTAVLDSANQFIPPPPTPFDMQPGSTFLKEVMEVYEAVNTLCDEKSEIAQFWDCNPYVSHHKGHAMFATKKITPGGHWMGITGIAARKAGLDVMGTIEAYSMVSIALFDGFISCWDEKWRSILIRPETVINQYIDENWVPLLQTPPFPEYTSGHSVISAAASTTLTHLLGDHFQFNDSTEVEYGLPIRSFNSFNEASKEAAISRLYGGIHYMPAITHGVEQGHKVGKLVTHRINTRKTGVALQ
ncbi:MAG: vanadium-dependent haloperoxidase [Cyclobacteriaceae bacterium]|nr:vanadium-dependent haloperoxidase [Cyclobacteriaceae bacterium]